MRSPVSRRRALAFACVIVFASAVAARAQTGYGVSSNSTPPTGTLFSFVVNNAGTVNVITSTLPFVPEGIDFRPGTR